MVKRHQINDLFFDLTGFTAESYSFPGLEGRDKSGNKTVLMNTPDGNQYIMTFRHKIEYAELESEVLRLLSEQNAGVPKFINRSGHWLVQEHISGRRLSEVLNTKKETTFETAFAAVMSLIKIQDIAKKIDLETMVKPICNSETWRDERIEALFSLASLSKVDLPEIQIDQIREALQVNPRTFIKWDARPGNAIVSGKDDIYWFDWEHCGLRAGIDDLIWFLTDEWLNISPEEELEIICELGNFFNDDGPQFRQEKYLKVFGTIHMCGKLLKILECRELNAKWLDRDFCLEHDLMGVNHIETKLLIEKAIRWAEFDKLTRPLTSWLCNIGLWLDEDSLKN